VGSEFGRLYALHCTYSFSVPYGSAWRMDLDTLDTGSVIWLLLFLKSSRYLWKDKKCIIDDIIPDESGEK
jgi:hypothetical protein